MSLGLIKDGEKKKILGGGGSGGHTIQNQSGTALAQEPAMKFADLHTSDDSTNNATIVQTLMPVTAAAFEALPTTGAADGLYLITDGSGGSGGQTTANMVSYDNTTSQMTATNVQDAIDELAAGGGAGYVEVTANGVKTTAALCTELYALIDFTKLNNNSTLEIIRSSTNKAVHHISNINQGTLVDFYREANGNSFTVRVHISNSMVKSASWGSAATDDSAIVETSGVKYRIIY